MEREEEAHESKERGREGRGSEGRGSELLRCGAKRPMTAFAGKAEAFGLRPLFVRAGGH